MNRTRTFRFEFFKQNRLFEAVDVIAPVSGDNPFLQIKVAKELPGRGNRQIVHLGSGLFLFPSIERWLRRVVHLSAFLELVSMQINWALRL